jgi:drug/metabolite transporter superfamily protein YnfA
MIARRKETSRKTKITFNIYLVEIGGCHVDWFDLAQHRHKWRALVNAVMIFLAL